MTKALSGRTAKPVAIWLLVGVGMLIVQILLGGITRLTGSGLSITEWDVVTGTLPPLNQAEWEVAFEKYKQTPQFGYLNSDFTLSNFKFIFFWEWFHRFWARLLGVVFLVPFIIFLVQRRFKPEMVRPLIILFLLGALQGAVGWIMVASGLTGNAIYVKPTRLALHFIFAIGLLCYTYWFALQLLVPRDQLVPDRKTRNLTWAIIAILAIQLVYGALMAGHKAATAAPTWPDINGYFAPPGMMKEDQGLLNLIDNRMTIHFIHRGLAYILCILIILLTIRLFKTPGTALYRKFRSWPLILVIFQIIAGILAVTTSLQIVPNQWGTFEWVAQLHQAVAMVLVISLLSIAFVVDKR
ncbi:MAG TPA: COX15/CtaA family protein [Chitinophagaceae bacterium]